MNTSHYPSLELVEQWKPIQGYESLYEISNLWKVRWITSNEIRINCINKWYLRIDLWKASKSKNKTIHRLVATHFIPNPLNLPQVNHLDGNKLNCREDNLEWCTAKENIQHSFRVIPRKILRWKDHPMYWRRIPNAYFITKNAKSMALHQEIYEKLQKWIWPYILAKEYNLSPQTIYNIKKKYETRTQG